MLQALTLRLGELGLAPPAEDEGLLQGLLERAVLWILAETGQGELPDELESAVVDVAAGEYLLWRKNMGSLECFDETCAVQKMSQGDTSITYAVAGGAISPLDALIAGLRTPREALMRKWRRMRW